MRLARFGYRSETIGLPTYEDGPSRWKVWLPQRSRWFKGWLATWLVHMRDPGALFLDLGWRSFGVMQILCVGLVASALVHPLMLGFALALALTLLQGATLAPWQMVLFVIDVGNIVAGYASFLILGWHALSRAERRHFPRIALVTPLYWLMLSCAAWRAVWQLARQPHRWEKTPHLRSRSAVPPSRQQVTV